MTTPDLIATTEPRVCDLRHSLHQGLTLSGTNSLAEWDPFPDILAP